MGYSKIRINPVCERQFYYMYISIRKYVYVSSILDAHVLVSRVTSYLMFAIANALKERTAQVLAWLCVCADLSLYFDAHYYYLISFSQKFNCVTPSIRD